MQSRQRELQLMWHMQSLTYETEGEIPEKTDNTGTYASQIGFVNTKTSIRKVEEFLQDPSGNSVMPIAYCCWVFCCSRRRTLKTVVIWVLVEKACLQFTSSSSYIYDTGGILIEDECYPIFFLQDLLFKFVLATPHHPTPPPLYPHLF